MTHRMGFAGKLTERFDAWDRAVRAKYNVAPDTPENARKARIYMLWLDHEILRIPWTNEYQIAPGVFRSNQPTRARLESLKARGITRIINLRGDGTSAHHMSEKMMCAELGIDLITVQLNARKPPKRHRLLELIELLRTTERPFLMHCKSGADRTGLAAAVHLLVHENATIAEARRMFSTRYAHLRWTSTGVLDHILDVYEARQADGAIGFEDWVRTEYDDADIRRSFDALPVWRR